MVRSTGVKVSLVAASVIALLCCAVTPANAVDSTATCTSAGTGGRPLTKAGATVGTIDVLDGLAQVLPTHRFAGGSAATVCAARNSTASFQLSVTASTSASITGLTLSASDLTGPNNTTLSGTNAKGDADVQFAREDYTTLKRLSDSELDPNGGYDTVTPAASRVARNQTTGACTASCRFPDRLIPQYDQVYKLQRNAFANVTVPAGENRTFWTDVFVPLGTTPGTYTGTISVTSTSGGTATVPMQVQVVQATLPGTSSLHSAFFWEAPGDSTGYRQAAELGLNDRISVVPDGDLGAAIGTVLPPLLAGTDPAVRLLNSDTTRAALTSFPIEVAFNAFKAYKPYFTSSVKTKPWAYSDEGDAGTAASNYAKNVAGVWPGLPMLSVQSPGGGWPDPEVSVVPSGLTSSVGGVVGIVQYLKPDGWIPPSWSTTTHTADTADRAPYLTAWAAKATGREVWSYSSDQSGHSGPYSPQHKQNVGFASLGIDQVASEQLATGWTSYLGGLTGQLYWSVDQDSSVLDGATRGLSGDGLLFYPWDSAVGAPDKPVLTESIRLKRIRQGMQDYELLRLANTTSATTIAKNLFPSASAVAVAATAVDAAEQSLYRLFPLPANPSAPAKAVRHDVDGNGIGDLLGVQAGTGNLLFYPRNATDWAPNAPVNEGGAYGTSSTSLTYPMLQHAGDLTGDGKSDLLGRKADGSLWLMRGAGSGGFGAATKLTTVTTSPVAVSDFDGDTKADLLDVHSDGTLWLIPGTGSGTFGTAKQAGAGWGSLELVGVGDFNGDGPADVIARRTDGSLLLYEGNGTGGWKNVDGGISMGLTLPKSSYPVLVGAGDVTADGHADLIATDTAGTMWAFPGTGSTTFGAKTRIGSGWGSSAISEIAR